MRVLLLDTDDSLKQSVAPYLEEVGYEVTARRDPDAALLEAQACGIRSIVCDLALPNDGALTFLRRYRSGGGTGVVLVCGGPSEAMAASLAVREGADGFLRKPALPEEVLLALRQTEERDRLRHEVATLRATIGSKGLEPMVVAEDPKMRTILEVAARAAASDQAVIITGEPGTGKALLARAMHRFSRRGDGAFVAIDCNATPDFFGPNGDSAGASPADPQSVWRSASRGTLLLEDIESLTPESQSLLVSRLGQGNRNGSAIAVAEADVRLMATAEKQIGRLIDEGKLRPDLAQRLGITTLDLPPLRERRDDIPALVTHFLQQVAAKTGRPISITPQAMAALVSYSWPNNVRELRQVVERAAVLSPSGKLDRSDFPVLVSAGRNNGGTSEFALKPQVEAFEREIILRALAACGGTRREAARLLKISLRTLFYKLRRYGLA